MISNKKLFVNFLIIISIFCGLFVVYQNNSYINTEKTFQLTKSVQDSPSNHFTSICGTFPNIQEIYEKLHWQIFRTKNYLQFLYGAYYDDRDVVQPLPVVRVLTLANSPNVTESILCYLWYEGHISPTISKVITIDVLWSSAWKPNVKGYSPYLLSCENPLNIIPKFVSLVEEKCEDANNLLEIIHKPKIDKKKNFLVCLKNMKFTEDISSLVIEWFEILKILKADKIKVYVAEIHPNTEKVLKLYESQGFIDITHINYPNLTLENFDSFQKRHNELISYQDCFYRNFNEFDYVIPMDIDEIIVPLKSEDKSWTDLMKRILAKNSSNSNFDSYEARKINFFHNDEKLEKIHPDHKIYHFLENTLRVSTYAKPRAGTKSFISTKNAYIIHNHYPLKCLKGNQSCKNYQIELTEGQLSHYRSSCTGEVDWEDCKKTEVENAVNDTCLWKFKDEVIRNIEETFKKLKN